MAKGQMRGNREIRKPKADKAKAKPEAQTVPGQFAAPQNGVAAKKKKG